ncbi:MAG: DUF4293 family protein [Roseivirga sp.]
MSNDDRRLWITGLEALERPQSIGFMTVCVAMMVLSMGAFWTKTTVDPEITYTLHAWFLRGLDPEGLIVHETFLPYALLGLMSALSSATAMYQLFRFDSRPTQLAIGATNTLFISATLYLAYYFCERLESNITSEIASQHSREAFITILVALSANALAALFILRDERLIRTVGRLRSKS